MMKKTQGLGRRAFLRGVGGATLSLPFLSMLNGTAGGQERRPTRIVIVFHSHGTLLDRWRPSATGALSGALPALLSPLEPHKAKLNVLSGIDNVVNQMNRATNGHDGAARTLLTCEPFVGVKSGQQPANAPADGPSIDWVLGPKLQGGAPRSVINLGVTEGDLGSNTIFWRASDQAASVLCDPRSVANTLFSGINTTGSTSTPPVTPPAATREELFRRRKGSVIDAVAQSYKRLSQRAPAEDRTRLEAHMEQVRSLEKLTNPAGGAAPIALASCARPTHSLPGSYAASRSEMEQYSAAAQIENTVMALACNLAPVVTLQFVGMENPNFAFLFDNDTQAVLRGDGVTYNDWHALVHEAPANRDARGLDNLEKGFTFYMQQVANLVKRLSEVEDAPGQSLMENTLVLAISEFGDGAHHYHTDLPVLLLGALGGRLKTGQHLNLKGYTTGDLYTTLQAITTGDETPFGMRGTLPSGSTEAGRAFHRGLLPGLT